MYLEILSYIENKTERLKDLETIFFANAKVPIQTPTERENLFNKYARPYIENWPDDVFFACDLTTHKTMGYLIGCRNSAEAETIFEPLLKSYSLFSDQFKNYPAHLHMNVHPDFHGHGAGTFLVQEYIIELRKFGIHGLHLITSRNEHNVDFYIKNKFNFHLERSFKDRPFLFMGLRF